MYIRNIYTCMRSPGYLLMEDVTVCL